MIIVKNRELLIPEPERYIGTTYDTESEIRQFLISRFAQNGVDLSALTFHLDLKYANDAPDTVLLDKEVTDTNIILTWNIGSSVLQVPGTLFIQLRAADDEVTVKWSSFHAALYVERHLNTPGTYTGSLTEIEQMEQDHQYMLGVVDELREHIDYTFESEAWAVGKRDGEDVPSTDPTYHNNSKYYRQNAERYANGKEDGTPVSSGDGYHDNAKYYSEQSDEYSNVSEAYAKGTVDGTPVSSGQTGYQDNAKYYKEQAAATVADTNTRFDNAVAAVTVNTEVQDARVGADGTTYTVLKNRLDAEHTDVKSALGEKYTVLHGSYQSGVWASQYYSAFFKVVPGSTFSITAPSDNTTVYYGLRSASVPPTDGDAADFSTETGWTGTRNTAVGETESGVLPNDVNYLYFYFGTGSQPTARKPVSVAVDGIDLLGAAFDSIDELRLKAAQAEMDIDNMEDAHTDLENKVYAHPYGFEPFQMSMFKQSDNIFSDFCYHLVRRYYRARVDTTVARPRITETSNYQGWLIRVKPNTTYTLGPVDFQIEILTSDFDLSRRFVSGMSSTEPNTITTKSNACWLCLTQRMTRDMSEWMMVEGDTYPSEYVSGYPQWVLDPIPSTGVATPKTIAFMGDSITAGVATAKCYHQYLHDKYGCVCLNYGFGGSGYYRNSASQSSGKHGTGVPGMGVVTSPENFFTPNNIIARLGELDASAINGIVIFAGTNDWGNGVSMENFTDAVDNAFTYCQTNFPLIPVLVMLPIHRKGDTAQNSQGKTLRDYCDVIISMCVKHGLPYVDTMTDSGIYPDNDANKGAYFTTDTSGLHPSALGHKRIASVIWDMLDAIISYPDFQ